MLVPCPATPRGGGVRERGARRRVCAVSVRPAARRRGGGAAVCGPRVLPSVVVGVDGVELGERILDPREFVLGGLGVCVCAFRVCVCVFTDHIAGEHVLSRPLREPVHGDNDLIISGPRRARRGSRRLRGRRSPPRP